MGCRSRIMGVVAALAWAGAAHAQFGSPANGMGLPAESVVLQPAPDFSRIPDAVLATEQTRLAHAYLKGTDGYPKDEKRACKYAERASLERADAMHLLGDCYKFGYGGHVNAAKAEKAYARAQAMGYVETATP